MLIKNIISPLIENLEFKFDEDEIQLQIKSFKNIPQFIKNKFEGIKKLKVFNIQIQSEQEEGNDLKNLSLKTDKLLENSIFYSNGFQGQFNISYVTKIQINFNQDGIQFKFDEDQIQLEKMIITFKKLSHYQLSKIQFIVRQQVTEVTNEDKLQEFQSVFTDFLKSQSNLSEFTLRILDKNFGIKPFNHIPQFIKNKFGMVKNLKVFNVQIQSKLDEENSLLDLALKTDKELKKSIFHSNSFQGQYNISYISYVTKIQFSYNKNGTQFKFTENKIQLETMINTFKKLSHYELSKFMLHTYVIVAKNEDKLQEFQSVFTNFFNQQSNLSEFWLDIQDSNFGIKSFNGFPQFIQNKYEMIKNMKVFRVYIYIKYDEGNVLKELNEKTSKSLKGTPFKVVNEDYCYWIRKSKGEIMTIDNHNYLKFTIFQYLHKIQIL